MAWLYRHLLGDAFDRLPAAVRSLHGFDDVVLFDGTFDCTRGDDPVCVWLADRLGLPQTGDNQAAIVSFAALGHEEKWVYTLGGVRLDTVKRIKRSSLIQKADALEMVFAVRATEQELILTLRNAFLFGFPIKWLLRPKVKITEYEEYGVFHFFAEARLPFFGLLIHMKGRLKQAMY